MTRSHEESSGLSPREKELTALGAAIASNCVPCIEYHVPRARSVGLTDAQLREAAELADKVRQVPADKVLQTTFALLKSEDSGEMRKAADSCGCK